MRKYLPNTRNRARLQTKARNARGYQLVELLIALTILSFVCTELARAFSLLLTNSSYTQNQLCAQDIAAQVLDNARNQTYNELKQEVGTHVLTVNDMGGASFDNVFNRPLLQDNENLVFSADAQTSRFRADTVDGGKVTEFITETPDGMVVRVEVLWREKNYEKRYECSTTISENGIHN